MSVYLSTYVKFQPKSQNLKILFVLILKKIDRMRQFSFLEQKLDQTLLGESFKPTPWIVNGAPGKGFRGLFIAIS